MKPEFLKLVNSYCTILKRCMQYYNEKAPNKQETYAHTRRGLLFINDFPLEAVELTGVKLWKYREVVNKGQFKEIEHACTKESSDKTNTPETQKDIAESVIYNITMAWQLLENEEKVEFTQQIQELLKIYAQILLFEKTNQR